MFYPQLDVAELTGQRGLTIDYSNLIDRAAYAGDLNADGIEDRVLVMWKRKGDRLSKLLPESNGGEYSDSLRLGAIAF